MLFPFFIVCLRVWNHCLFNSPAENGVFRRSSTSEKFLFPPHEDPIRDYSHGKSRLYSLSHRSSIYIYIYIYKCVCVCVNVCTCVYVIIYVND